MSDHDQGLGSRISGSIHEHVDRLSPAHVSLRDVQQRAGRIRRNRRIAVVSALAAVTAVVVPTALLTVSRPAGDDAPAPVASGSADPTATADPTAAAPIDLTVPDDPVVGEAPRVAWLQDETLHLPDGTERSVQRPYDALVVLGARIYGSWYENGGDRFLDIDDGQGTPETVGTTDAAVVDRAGTLVAWGEPDGTVRVGDQDSTTDLGRQPGPVAPVAVTGDARCELDEASSCAVYLNPLGQAAPSIVTSSGQSGALEGLLKVNDVDGTLLAGQTSYEDGRACSELSDRTSGDVPWRTCRYALGRFSPDARHLLALPSDIDGLGSRTLYALSADTGEPVATWSVEEGFVAAQAWEDDEHVLVVRYSFSTSRWDVLRLGLDGTVQRVVEPVEGVAEERPVTLAGNR